MYSYKGFIKNWKVGDLYINQRSAKLTTDSDLIAPIEIFQHIVLSSRPDKEGFEGYCNVPQFLDTFNFTVNSLKFNL